MKRLLVANRGEIALRIMRGARELGIETVAIYSDADADAPHVRFADHAAHVGPTPAPASYLNVDNVIAAAKQHGADAVHPGYGFLSENPAFAERVVAEGLVFVGPSGAAMRAAGDKQRAKQLAAQADVPTVPEFAPDAVPDDAYPVLVKAAAGGGGRGMRVVERAHDLPAAVESAAREAKAGFGDDTLLVEQLVTGARHVEVQLLADGHGTTLYVGDRDCSLQRRHQKVVEEAPAFGLSDELRRELGEAAVRIARAASYENAGTAEFLVAPDGSFYFLELNARLQVEHPATEMAFGIDLVQWQLRIARGEQLDLRQADVAAQAHAIEARVYAEDPVTFLPTGGRVLQVRLPDDAGVRVDHSLAPRLEVSLAYDPLLAKVIAAGATREEARQNLLHALRSMVVLGVVTNQALLQHALQLDAFVHERHTIETLEAHPLGEEDVAPPDGLIERARAQLRGAASGAAAREGAATHADPFVTLGTWRLSEDPPVAVDATAAATLGAADELPVAVWGDRLWVSADGITYEAARDHVDPAAAAAAHDAHGDRAALTAPMPGTVLTVLEPGTAVRTGEAVVVLEAMKMENAVAAPFDGVVEAVGCAVGQLVAKGAVLAEITR